VEGITKFFMEPSVLGMVREIRMIKSEPTLLFKPVKHETIGLGASLVSPNIYSTSSLLLKTLKLQVLDAILKFADISKGPGFFLNDLVARSRYLERDASYKEWLETWE
jgi:hypothetical protein